MIGELIPTGVTFGVGRVSLNTQFSGTADFNNVEVSGNLSAGTGGVIYSGGTDLYNIFLATADGNDITRVQPGSNITTGGTDNQPIINLVSSPSVNNITFSGSAIGSSLSATTLSGGTIYSGGTDLYDIFSTGVGVSLWLSGTGVNAIIQDGSSNIASGDSSVAQGFSTVAGGFATHSEGEGTFASGQYSHAEGYYTTTIGVSTHAEGDSTVAIGNQSHAEGQYTTSIAIASHTEGDSTIASGLASHAEGYYSIAAGIYSHAEGRQSTASGSASHSEGWGTKAIGSGSHAEGGVDKVGGLLATSATTYSSHAEGAGTLSSGPASHAEGTSTSAVGSSAHAEGESTTASGTTSHAEGYSTIAIGNYSHAGGFESTAIGTSSFVHGSASVASGASTVVFGNNITGATANTVYVPNLNINTAPSNDNALTQLLVRATDGTIKYRDSSSFVSSSGSTIRDLSNTYVYYISGNSGSSEQINLESHFSPSMPARLTVGRSTAMLESDSGTSVIAQFRAEGGIPRMFKSIGIVDQRIEFGSSSTMIVKDDVNLRGLEYNANYHSNYTTRSLVDKEYVDNVISTATTSSVGINPYLDLGTTGSTITWNVSGLSTNYEVTLSAATTLNLTNVRNGEYGTIIVKQDAVGGRTITLGTVNGGAGTHRVINGGGGSITLTSTANATDILSFTYNGSVMYWTVGNDYT